MAEGTEEGGIEGSTREDEGGAGREVPGHGLRSRSERGAEV